jgi:hypothetical protein
MPKITDGQFALGGLAFFAIWVFVVLPFLYGPPPRFAETSRPPKPHSEQAQQQAASKPDGSESAPFFIKIPKTAEEAAQEAEDRRDKATTDRWLMIFTGAVALFTLLLVGATILLYRAGERQLRHLAETSERQLRAYVFPIEARLTKFTAGHPLECRIAIENSGQTPAYRLTHMARIGLVNFPPKEPHPECESSETTSKTNIGPRGKIDKFGAMQWPLTEEWVTLLNSRAAAIYVYGRIDFTDAFGRPRWVKYRYMTGGNEGFDREGRLAICQEGNETSED